MTDLKLPELPEAAFRREIAPAFYKDDGTRDDWYSPEQMTAYATAAVLAERAAAEADAKRYRWLRDRAGMGFIATLNMRRESDEWDGEIDAAMAAAEEWNAGIDAAIQESHDDAR